MSDSPQQPELEPADEATDPEAMEWFPGDSQIARLGRQWLAARRNDYFDKAAALAAEHDELAEQIPGSYIGGPGVELSARYRLRSEYNGPRGSAPVRKPLTMEEDMAALDAVAEAEARDMERSAAHVRLAQLGREEYGAIEDGDTARAEELRRQRTALALGIRERFGY